jgi:hypothetical protein
LLSSPAGLDPKTGHPLNYDPAGGVQIYAEGSHGTRAKPNSEKLCPMHGGGKNWEPTAYNPDLGLLYIPSIEGCDFIETVEQKDFADQGGTVKPRERFAGVLDDEGPHARTYQNRNILPAVDRIADWRSLNWAAD